MYVHVRVYIHVRMYVHVCLCVCMYMYVFIMYLYMYVYVYVYVFVCISVYMYAVRNGLRLSTKNNNTHTTPLDSTAPRDTGGTMPPLLFHMVFATFRHCYCI